ncbi:MAG: RHS repeat-associated core domain-containing protein, partial [Sphingomicrobium sp.]
RDNDGYAFTGIAAVNKAYSVNGLNQYSAVAGTGYLYDASGNLTYDGFNAFTYDGENRLVSALAAGQTTTLTYDPLGRLWRVQKGQSDTRFLYDGDALVAEYNSGSILSQRYVRGSNAAADDPLVWYENGTTKRYLHTDHLGSIVAATNVGSAPTINAYDEYGVPKAGNAGRFQYTGQIWLSELGLYHYKARLYDPKLGRFLQVDPTGYDDQINLYAYVADDPINADDPTGECTGSAFSECTGLSVAISDLGIEHAGFQQPGSNAGATQLAQRSPGSGRVGTPPAGASQQLIEARIGVLQEQIQRLSPGAPPGFMNPPGQRTLQAVRSLESQIDTLKATPLRSNAEARSVANALGFKEVGARVRGQAVFTDGRSYITRDIPSRTTNRTHSGGVWKMANSVRALQSRQTRAGTWNRDLLNGSATNANVRSYSRRRSTDKLRKFVSFENVDSELYSSSKNNLQ